MKRGSITDAKNRLGVLLKRLCRRETVLIEDRGVAVAQIAPVARGVTGTDRDTISRLQRAGIIRPPGAVGPCAVLLEPPPRPVRPASISLLLMDERDAGR